MMSERTKVLRNTLILFALVAAAPWALAAQAPPPATAGFHVPIQSASLPPTPRLLDLKAPDIRQVMSADQIAAAIPNPDDTEVLEPETVAVQGEVQAPYVPSGFAALYWAAIHPLDSWRILAPVQ